MGNPLDPSYMQPEWLWGQLLATRKLIQALARCSGVENEWRERSQADLQQLLDLLTNSTAPEGVLAAVDEVLAYVKTAPSRL